MTFTSVNPHDPADTIGEWEPAGQRDADAAVGPAGLRPRRAKAPPG